jgi:hypothetical protein
MTKKSAHAARAMQNTQSNPQAPFIRSIETQPTWPFATSATCRHLALAGRFQGAVEPLLVGLTIRSMTRILILAKVDTRLEKGKRHGQVIAAREKLT